ncbi:MAG: UMP kinase [Burkholderiales bacterium]|nr:UMP kinase [Burkholderiales bacterium]
MTKEEIIIISLGGSLIIPDDIDVDFLKDFKELILSQIERGNKFVIVTGGGKICRKYQTVAKEISSPSSEDLDWIGIASLRLNAQLLRVIFRDHTHPKIIKNPLETIIFDKPVVVGSANEPGHSTDWDAVMIAKNVGAKKVINLSNTDYVYDSDPRTNENAKRIEKISWNEYRKLIPEEWNPGLNTPFDPIASEVAEKEGIEVVIMNGKPILNLANYLDGKDFKGTIIY